MTFIHQHRFLASKPVMTPWICPQLRTHYNIPLSSGYDFTLEQCWTMTRYFIPSVIVGMDHCEWACVCRNLYCWHLNRTKYEISCFGIFDQAPMSKSANGTTAEYTSKHTLWWTLKKAQLHEEGNNNSVCSTTLLDAVQWQCNTVLNEQRPIQNNPSPSIEGLGPLPSFCSQTVLKISH